MKERTSADIKNQHNVAEELQKGFHQRNYIPNRICHLVHQLDSNVVTTEVVNHLRLSFSFPQTGACNIASLSWKNQTCSIRLPPITHYSRPLSATATPIR